MSEEVNLDTASYLRCEINGTQFILQAVPDYEEGIVNVMPQEKVAGFTDVLQYENEENSIPLVYLDRQIYTFQNGELREFDLSKYMDQSNGDPESVIMPKEEGSENAADSVIPEYLTEDDIFIEDVDIVKDPGDNSYNIALVDDKKFIIGQDGLNANDFVEVVTAFKCKICPYTTQDRMQLLEHFENVHINPLAEVNSFIS